METTYAGITILQGDNITFSCRPSKSDIALQWSFNGSDISSSQQYQFTTSFLNHDLTITHANVSNSGNYVCAIIMNNRTIDQQSITLTVISSEHNYLQMYIHVLKYICICRSLVSFNP